MTEQGQRIAFFDSHFHIIDPRFPMISNQGYLPEPYSIEDYRRRTAAFDIVGGAIVSASFQGFDQSYLLEALRRLGPTFVGVTQLPPAATDEEIMALHAAGIRAIRFNLYRGGTQQLDVLEALARRVFALVGWHAEFYVDSRNLPELMPLLYALPRICIDHLGLFQEGLQHVLKLVEHGVYVKATGFGRGDLDIPRTLREIYAVNPAALVFASDLPCTRTPRPFQDSDVILVRETMGEQASQQIFLDNAVALYHPVAEVRTGEIEGIYH